MWISQIMSEISTLDPVKQEYYLKLINSKLPDTTTLGALKQTMKSVNKERAETPKHDNPLNQLLSLFYNSGSTAFKDQLGEGWVTVRVNNHYENIRIRSSEFGNLMLDIYHRNYDTGVAKETVEQLGSLLIVRSTEERYLFNRYAWLGDRLLIDLGDPDWTVIEVTEEGWGVVQPDKSVFRRFSHQLPMPVPKRGGDINKVFNYLSIRDGGNRALLLVWLCTCMLEHIPRPGIILHGIQGSCKTSGADFIRRLVDPSRVPHSSLSKNHAEFIQFIDHNAVVSLDNISSLPPWACDTLCTAITGGGHSKRSLYTNDDDFPYSFRRVFILNGISVPTTAPDLLDRSKLIELSRLEKKDRKTITKLTKSFDEDSPLILGQILDVLVYVISRRHEELTKYSRLADWEGSALIAAEKLRLKAEFIKALDRSEAEQHIEIVESHLESQILIEFMAGRDSWDGPKGELYNQLTAIAHERGEKKYWTKTVSAFGRKLKELYHNLREMGIKIRDYREDNTRKVEIKRFNPSEPNYDVDDVFSQLQEGSGFGVLPVPAVFDNHIIGIQCTASGISLVRGAVLAVHNDNNAGPIAHKVKNLSPPLPVHEPRPPIPEEVRSWSKPKKETFYMQSDWYFENGMNRGDADKAALNSVKSSPNFSSLSKENRGFQDLN